MSASVRFVYFLALANIIFGATGGSILSLALGLILGAAAWLMNIADDKEVPR